MPPAEAAPGGGAIPYLSSVSLIVRGTAIAEITAIGTRTEIRRIRTSLNVIETAPTPLHLKTGRLVRQLKRLPRRLAGFVRIVTGLPQDHVIDAVRRLGGHNHRNITPITVQGSGGISFNCTTRPRSSPEGVCTLH